MNYRDALKEAERVGAKNAEGDALLAQTCQMLSGIHAVHPALVYHGAKTKGMGAVELLKLAHSDPHAFGDLMFVGIGDEVTP